MNSAIIKSDRGLLGVTPGYRSGSTNPRFVDAVTRKIFEWNSRVRQRRHLQRLDDHLLRDIGTSREQVWAELSKSFWQK